MWSTQRLLCVDIGFSVSACFMGSFSVEKVTFIRQECVTYIYKLKLLTSFVTYIYKLKLLTSFDVNMTPFLKEFQIMC